MDIHCFKIWNLARDVKIVVTTNAVENLLLDVIAKGSQKLKIDGSNLVLESDGTLVDEDSALIALKGEKFILLTKNQLWSPAESLLSCETQSNSSTCTVSSRNSEIFSDNEIKNTSDTENSNFPNKNMEYLWSNFIVPWEKMPANIIIDCKEQKLNFQNLHQLIHIVVNEMRQIKNNIPMKAFRYVAKQIIDKYPNTFRDCDSDGVVIGDGTHSLIMKLSDRNHYLNRPHKRQIPELSVSNSLKKRRLNHESMCSNYEPAITTETPESKKQYLNEPNVIEDEEYYKLLEETYPEQRKFLNNLENPPTVLEILEKWPVLLKKSAVYWHFKKLTDINIIDMEKHLLENGEKILKFAKSKKLFIPNIEKNRIIQQCLEFYAASFKEDLSSFIYTFKEGYEVSNINTMSPCIIEFSEHNRWDVVLEKHNINSFLTFLEAFKYCFALYFINNMEYPKKLGATLEMIQRYHLKLHPMSGSKSTTTKKKVFTLMNKLKHI